jgi:superfamily I DNA/RNA helicase
VDTIARQVGEKKFHPGDFAVMYRTNAQSRVLEEAFLHAGLPYKLVGAQRFYGRREIKDVIAYLRLIHNPNDELSLGRIINVPARGIGDKTMQTLRKQAQASGVSPASLLLSLVGTVIRAQGSIFRPGCHFPGQFCQDVDLSGELCSPVPSSQAYGPGLGRCGLLQLYQ